MPAVYNWRVTQEREVIVSAESPEKAIAVAAEQFKEPEVFKVRIIATDAREAF